MSQVHLRKPAPPLRRGMEEGITMAHIDDLETHRANSAFIRTSMRAPILDRDHELALARRWREGGDQTALHELVTSFTRLVVSIAVRFRHYGLPMGDLIQEGNLGLMQAAARFEPERDVRFSTYATWWIRANMQDFILRNWRTSRCSSTCAGCGPGSRAVGRNTSRTKGMAGSPGC